MKIYKSAQEFIKRYNLKKNYTYDDLKLIAGKQGCLVYEWSLDLQKDEAYLRNAGCLNLARTANGFSCMISDTKVAFIKRTLIEQEKKILLLHENIHIFYGHIVNKNEPLSVAQEKQTTDTHYMIDLILNYKKYIVPCLVLNLILIASLCGMGLLSGTQANASDCVYITPTGHHYHANNCLYGREYINSFEISRAVAEEHYLPCDLCNPEK